MILLTLSRGKGEETVRLQLPASPAEIGEAFASLDRISLDTTATAILDVSSNVPVLYRCLYDVDVEDSEQFQKLQKLAERTEALSPAKAAIFSGALDAECVWNLEGALTVADRLDEYTAGSMAAPSQRTAGVIINLPHPTSAKHPRMPLSDRAAQFAPFAALSGHSAALAETARLTDQRMELDEDARAALDLKQQLLLERIKERPEITATWFQPDEKKDGGRYIVSTGRLKRIHEADQVLILADGLRIPIGDIVELESECIRGLL